MGSLDGIGRLGNLGGDNLVVLGGVECKVILAGIGSQRLRGWHWEVSRKARLSDFNHSN